MLELNLLNPTERDKAKNIKNFYIIKHIVFQLMSLLIIVSSIFYISILLIQANLDSVNQQVENEIQIRIDSNLNSIEDATIQLNTQLQLVNSIQSKYFIWTKFLNNFSTIIPDSISLNEVEFTTNFITSNTDKTFKIEGIAPTREDFIQLEDNLKNSTYFININAPISNLIQKENISFTITGNLINEKIN